MIVDDYQAIAIEHDRLFGTIFEEDFDIFELELDELLLAEFTEDDIRDLLAALTT
jgi:hypothetical protein